MKGIRLTPFLLFLILLLVLVVAMIFGYRSNSVLENMETGNTGDWAVAVPTPVENYYNNRTLDEILASSGSTAGYYFDPNNGNPTYEEVELDMTPLPFIVVIIDEMADLMIVAGKEITKLSVIDAGASSATLLDPLGVVSANLNC